MSRLATTARAATSIVLATIMIAAGFVPSARAADQPDPSDIVLAFDLSSSILDDKGTREQFAGALNQIADSVVAQSDALVAGDATISMVEFASHAKEVPNCTKLELLNSPGNVTKFADCLRSVADVYTSGNAPAGIGTDTNYIEAMQVARPYLTPSSVRPALIFFTDGKAEVGGKPQTGVVAARDQLFKDLKSFALLPVGMGLNQKDRTPLETGLKNLKTLRGITTCSGAPFKWDRVVFASPALAGTAVATALQDTTCTFTAAIPSTPPPTPKPIPAVASVGATPGDGSIKLTWRALVSQQTPVIDYLARCRAGDSGDWVESTEGTSTEPTTTITGLTNGTAYQCEVAAVVAAGPGRWTPVSTEVTPIGKPATPATPTLSALDHAVQVGLGDPDPAAVTSYHVECSSDNGATFSATADVSAENASNTQIRGLTNGIEYACRAIAKNAVGESDASALSNAVKPCASLLDCNGLLVPVLGILGVVLAIGLLAVAFALWREGRKGYVIAVVDVVHTTNLGHGSRLGIGLIRTPGSKVITGIAADRTKNAEIKIRLLPGGRFSVRDGAKRHVTSSGEPLIVIVQGVRHELVLHAFATNAASRATSRS
jgi:hypothetical protein